MTEHPAVPDRHTYIDGRLLDGGGPPIPDLHPGDGSVITTVPGTAPALLDDAVAGALAAQPGWARTGPHERARILRDAAGLLESDADRLVRLITLDNGKTLAEARGDVLVAATHLRSAANWATGLEGSTLPADGSTLKLTLRDPVGLVAAIIPFNATLMFAAQKAGPALAAGNAIVLKAPEQSPLVAPALAELLSAAGLPDGLLQVVQGAGDVGRALVAHPAVTMVSFTGSTEVGRQVMRDAADGMKRTLLELGGKSANIVYADADLDSAVHAAVGGIFRNAGQRCFSGSRLLVQSSVADEVTERIARIADAIRVGDPFDPASDLGCLISRQQEQRVQRMIDDAVAAGAAPRAGGGRPADVHPDGAFLAPTVLDFRDLDPPAGSGPSIIRDEAFGPVLTVQSFDTVERAVELANDSPFGLVGGCWTRDLERALHTARAVRAGYFWINSYGALAPDAPIGGVGLSGVGRELGRIGHEAYTELRTVVVDTAPQAAHRWYAEPAAATAPEEPR